MKSSLLIILLILIVAGAAYVLSDGEVGQSSAISAQTQAPEVAGAPSSELAPAPRTGEAAVHRDAVQQASALEQEELGEHAPTATTRPSAENSLEVVVTSANGNQIEGAKVRARLVGAGPSPARSTFEAPPTDTHGRTAFASLPFKHLRVVASATDFAPGAGEVVKLTPDAPTEKIEIVLTQGGTVVGNLMDIRGAAADDVRLSIHLSAWPGQVGGGTTGLMQATQTDVDGNFQFTHLAPGLYTLYTRPSDEDLERVPEQQLKVDVLEGETTEVVFDDLTQSFVKLTGVVLRNREPIPNARINFAWADRSKGYLGKKCTADDTGRFQVLLDEAGEYRLQISGTGGRGSVFREVVIPAVEAHEIEIAFETGSLAGHVYGPNGAPVAGYGLTAFGRPGQGDTKGGSSISSTQSREDGSFEFTDLLASTYSVSAGALRGERDSSHTSLTPHLGAASVSGIVVSSGAKVQGIELRLAAAAAIEVLVVDRNGNPVENALLQCRPEGQSIHMASRTNSNAMGKSVIGGLNAGVYFVRGTLLEEASTWVSCTTKLNETAQVKLILEPGTTMQVSILENGQPAEDCHLSVYDKNGEHLSSQLVRRGSIALGPWTPASYRVVATTSERELKAEQIVVVSGQDSIPVQLHLQ